MEPALNTKIIKRFYCFRSIQLVASCSLSFSIGSSQNEVRHTVMNVNVQGELKNAMVNVNFKIIGGHTLNDAFAHCAKSPSEPSVRYLLFYALFRPSTTLWSTFSLLGLCMKSDFSEWVCPAKRTQQNNSELISSSEPWTSELMTATRYGALM